MPIIWTEGSLINYLYKLRLTNSPFFVRHDFPRKEEFLQQKIGERGERSRSRNKSR